MTLALRTLALLLILAVPAVASERLGSEECEVPALADQADDTPPADVMVSRRETAREMPPQVAPAPGAPRAPQGRVCTIDLSMASCASGSRDAVPEVTPGLRALDPCLLATAPAVTPPLASCFAGAPGAQSPLTARPTDRIERPPRT